MDRCYASTGVGQEPRSFGVMYHACGNGNGLHLWSTGCKWDWSVQQGQGISMWFGFHKLRNQKCATYGEINQFDIKSEMNDVNYHL